MNYIGKLTNPNNLDIVQLSNIYNGSIKVDSSYNRIIINDELKYYPLYIKELNRVILALKAGNTSSNEKYKLGMRFIVFTYGNPEAHGTTTQFIAIPIDAPLTKE